MPLLHKQKFIKKEVPENLDPNDDIFFCKLTQEIFLDYEWELRVFQKKKSQNGAPRRGLSNALGFEPFGALLAEESI